MLKKIGFVIVCLSVATLIWSAATVSFPTIVRPLIASKSVTTQYTATTWTLVDSIRVLQTGDSSGTEVSVSGEAELAPGQKLYIGFGHTLATKSLPDLDTFILSAHPSSPGITKSVRIPFIYRYTRRDSVAMKDTFYVAASQNFNGATLTLRNISLRASSGVTNTANTTAAGAF